MKRVSNIYKKRSTLKLVLLLLALIIALLTLFYTNLLTSAIAKEEERKVKLWADAIRNKAGLVKSTDSLFNRIALDERNYVKLWSDATSLLPIVEDPNMLTFLSEISRNNNKIPILLINEDNRIIGARNFEDASNFNGQPFEGEIKSRFSLYPPLQIRVNISGVNIINDVYYLDSKLFLELKEILNGQMQSFISEVVINSASVPVIMTDADQQIISHGNLSDSENKNQKDRLTRFKKMQKEGQHMTVEIADKEIVHIYYENSNIINQLKFFPFVQLAIFAGFLFLAYLAFSSSRNAEQNQVWVGMSKETAHQLGTPLSSLAAWLEIIRDADPKDLKDMQVVDEMEKDINRLNLIAERFSKIGSIPELAKIPVKPVLEDIISYFKARSSRLVTFELICAEDQMAFMHKELLDWVFENLIKNALDAMEGEGNIVIYVTSSSGLVFIDIEDSGKGIQKSEWNRIFQPGYTTKKRGWGLGLSLARRIIEIYHKGKIFVKHSEPGKGSTFRVVLNS